MHKILTPQSTNQRSPGRSAHAAVTSAISANAQSGQRRFSFSHALLSDGWARDVTIEVENGFIKSILTKSENGGQRFAGIALPGLPNIHSHAFQRAMAGLTEVRGPAQDDFWTWRDAMYRMLATWTPDDIEAIAAFCQMEMLEQGFTAVAEFHYLHHDVTGHPYADVAEMSRRIVAAAETSGIGLTLLPCFYAFGGFGGSQPEFAQRRFLNDPSRFLEIFSAAVDAISALPDAAIGVAPHSLRAVTPETLLEVISAIGDVPIHIHAAEQTREVEGCLSWSGQRPVEWLLNHTNVGPRWCIIHATHMTRQESERLAHSKAVVGLCPITEANLGDGILDAAFFAESGGRFAIGTDSNVQISASAELRQLEYSQRLQRRSRNVLAPMSGSSTGRFLYEQAASAGAQASAREIGSLREGSRADIVVLDQDHPDLSAIHDDTWLDAYIFSAGNSAIRSVICGGRVLVENGMHRRREDITARYKRSLAKLINV